MNSNYYVYIIKCRDDSFYIGYTNDLEKRIFTHNAKKGAKYTRGRTPITLIYYEKFLKKGEALSYEHSLKKLNRQQKERYIKENIMEEKKKKILDINKKLKNNKKEK